jgi:hypothetical protein
MMLVALGILLWSLAVPCTAQALLWQDWWKTELWWQEEIPPPTKPNQIINPEYIKKQQELNDSWNQLQRQNHMARQSHRWRYTTRNPGKSDGLSRNKITSLTSELKKTPMYVDKTAPPAPGPEPATEILLKY